MHFIYFHLFLGLMAHFSLPLNSVVWMYPLIHSPTEGHLIFFLISAILKKKKKDAIKHLCEGFYVDIKFKFIWQSTKKHSC